MFWRVEAANISIYWATREKPLSLPRREHCLAMRVPFHLMRSSGWFQSGRHAFLQLNNVDSCSSSDCHGVRKTRRQSPDRTSKRCHRYLSQLSCGITLQEFNWRLEVCALHQKIKNQPLADGWGSNSLRPSSNPATPEKMLSAFNFGACTSNSRPVLDWNLIRIDLKLPILNWNLTLGASLRWCKKLAEVSIFDVPGSWRWPAFWQASKVHWSKETMAWAGYN